MNGLEKGKALFEKQAYQEAIIVLTDFLAKQGNNADALYTRAICYRKNEEFKNSIEDLSTILKRLPNEPTLLCDRGISHFHNKDISLALKDMDKAVELDPNNPFRYSSRAYIRANIDVNSAIEDYKKAIELDPKDDISLNNLGLLEENIGKMSSAKNRYKKSNQIIGYNPEKRNATQKGDLEKVRNQENKSIGKIMLNVFTSKATREEYFTFLKTIFRKKTSN